MHNRMVCRTLRVPVPVPVTNRGGLDEIKLSPQHT